MWVITCGWHWMWVFCQCKDDDGCEDGKRLVWYTTFVTLQSAVLGSVTMDCCCTNFNLAISARKCLIRLTKSSVGIALWIALLWLSFPPWFIDGDSDVPLLLLLFDDCSCLASNKSTKCATATSILWSAASISFRNMSFWSVVDDDDDDDAHS